MPEPATKSNTRWTFARLAAAIPIIVAWPDVTGMGKRDNKKEHLGFLDLLHVNLIALKI